MDSGLKNKPKPKNAGTIRGRLLRSHVIFSVLTTLVVALVIFVYFQNVLKDTAREKLNFAQSCSLALVEKTLDEGRSSLRFLSKYAPLKESMEKLLFQAQGESSDLNMDLKRAAGMIPNLSYAALFGSNGELLTEIGAPIGEQTFPSCPQSPHDLAIGNPCFTDHTPCVTYTTRLNSGVRIFLTLKHEEFKDLLKGGALLGDSGKVLLGLRKEQNILLLSNDQDGSHKNLFLPNDLTWRNTEDPEGKQIRASFVPVVDAQWGLVIQQDLQEIQAPIKKAAGLIFLTTAILVSLSLFLSYKKMGPMADLLILWNRQLEDTVSQRTFELKKSEELYRVLTDSIADGAVIIQDQRIVHANLAFRNLMSLPDQGYQGSDFFKCLDHGDEKIMQQRAQLRHLDMTPEPRFNLRLIDTHHKTIPVQAVEKKLIIQDQEAWLLSVRDLGAIRRLQIYESVLPTCCVCKSIRDDSETETGKGLWIPLENYLLRHSHAKMSHTYCPACEADLINSADLG